MSVGFEVIRDVAVITLRNPPVNGLSKALRSGIITALDKSHGISGVKAVVMMGGKGNFCAGADIKEFASGTHLATPTLGEVFEGMEASSLPILASLHGPTLGGGLETALACHWRIAEDRTTQLGLPEVHLGILPGAGGTQRLPRLTGPEVALDLMTSGKFINAKMGLNYGIIDNVFSNIEVNNEIEEYLLQNNKDSSQYQHMIPDMYLKSLSYINDHVIPYHTTHKDVSSKLIRNLPPPTMDKEKSQQLFEKTRKFWATRQPNLRAPPNIISCVEFGCTTEEGKDLTKGLQFEAAKFKELSDHPQSSALQYAFFSDRGSFKSEFDKNSSDDSMKPLDVKSVAVIGAGTMGGGIAMCCLNSKLPVILIDISEEFVQAGCAKIEANYRKSSSFKNAPDAAKAEANLQAKLSLLTTQVVDTSSPATHNNGGFECLKDVDMVIEAVKESMDVKKAIFSAVSKANSKAILCSNTSTLNINEIAESLEKKEDQERVVGTHFFSPANIMRLLENVQTDHSSPQAVETIMKFGKKLNKVTILSQNCYGFIGNRMLEGYGQEAAFCVEEGASPKQVDAVLNKFGMAMGFFTMSDLAGNDIGYSIRKEFGIESPQSPFYNRRYPQILDVLPEKGYFGQKSHGKGWYQYDERRKPLVHEEADALIEDYRQQLLRFNENEATSTDVSKFNSSSHVKARYAKKEGGSGDGEFVSINPVKDEEILERTLFSLINEGFKILEEGIALSPNDIDAVWINGYGFPKWRGGPMYYADNDLEGKLPFLLCRLQYYHELYPNSPHLKPAGLLVECVECDMALAQLWKQKKSIKK